MFQVFLQSLAQAALERLFERNRGQYNRIEKAIDELSKRGFQTSNIKKLAGTKNIFRKRVGRWRILFTIQSNILRIWIIEIEKGTKQDYLRWILYIQSAS